MIAFLRVSVTALLLCFAGVLAGQNLLQPALNIRPCLELRNNGRYYFPSNPDQGMPCLAQLALAMGFDPTASVTPTQLLDALVGNPFIGEEDSESLIVIPDIYSNLDAAIPLMSRNGSRPVAPGRSPGVFSVSPIADGLAKFLVKRTKQELNMAFFERFQKAIQSDSRLSTLFPATAQLLGLIGDKIFQFDRYLNDLREAFGKDMRVLPSNAKVFLHDHPNLFGRNPEFALYSDDLLDLAQGIVDRRSPDSLLRFLAFDAAIQQPFRRSELTDSTVINRLLSLAGGMQTLNLISESLRSADTLRVWMPHNLVGNALHDRVTRALYLGLLWHRGVGIQFGKGITLRAGLTKVKQQTSPIVDNIMTIVKSGERIAAAQNQHRNAEAQVGSQAVVPYSTFHEFADGLLNMVQAGLRVRSVFSVDTMGDSRVLGAMYHLDNLNYDVRQGAYISAFNDLMMVLDQVLDSNQLSGFRKPLVRYGRFVATLAEADNSDEVAAALDAIALPPGSARLKKEATFSISLNAYTGVGLGLEKLDRTKKESTTLALSAPIGAAFNVGIGKRQSLSLFVPVMDVGALVAFRFKDPEADELPELSWKNIFAPGLYVVWGPIKKLPFVLGLGAQRGPNLRSIHDPNFPDIKTDSGWRYGGFLSVDIPIFNLFSR